MNRRGITLTEVLVAIFVTGLGLMALMTLFPLGAVNMALAIKDDRAQHAAANAAAYLRTVWRQGLESGQPDPGIAQGLAHLATNKQPGPAYLDPIGQLTYAGGAGASVTGTMIPRISLASLGGNQALTYQYFSLLDDIDFGYNGAPSLPSSCRETLYTWAYMLRPPQPGNPRVLDYSIVVYNRRSAVLGTNNFPAGEIPAQAMFNETLGTITVSGTHKVKKGDWVLDATPANPPTLPQAHAYFYRVDSVTQGGGTLLKVDQALRGFDDTGGQGQGVIVIMSNVVAVFEKSTLE